MYDTIILGAGPAGTMAALSIKGEKVLIIDANDKVAKKLSLSGGGRCNITNNDDYTTFLNNIDNDKFFMSTLKNFDNYSLYDFIAEQNIKLKLEGNKYFPISNNGEEISKKLGKKLKDNVDLKLNTKVFNVDKKDDIFAVNTSSGVFNAKSVVVATGGVSFKAWGATDIGFKIAKEFDIKVNELFPTNTALLTAPKPNIPGMSLDSQLTYNNKTVTGPFIFTHTGLSGPAIFKLTGKNVFKGIIEINFLKKSFDDVQVMLKESLACSNKILKNELSNIVPEKLLLELFGPLLEKKCNILSKDDYATIAKQLTSYKMNVVGHPPIDQSITSGGGIDKKEVSPKTFESKKVKGLYFIGECLDYFAPTGGYNLTLCFSQGYSLGLNKK